jgi:signal transduction histidine kinase
MLRSFSVFYNLLRNACKELPTQSGLIQVNVRTCSANHLSVRIADSGSGIAEQIRDKLFKPFVSYGKENGTGLGLAIVHKIVRDHGGLSQRQVWPGLCTT